MKTFLVIFALFLTLTNGEEEVKTPFIVGGVDAHILDFPYMAGIHLNYRREGFVPVCGSSIINRRSLLTAAHCLEYDFMQVPPQDIKVSVGSSYRLGTTAIWYRPFRLIRHPAYFYDGNQINADVAIVRLLLPIIYSPVARPIPLGSFYVNAGDKVTLTGWGFIHPSEWIPPTRLQALEMTAMTNIRCWNHHRDYNMSHWVTSEMVCLETNYENQGSCGGDSGGPITLNGYVVGISCWTMRPCGSGPSVYVRVSEHYDWISANV